MAGQTPVIAVSTAGELCSASGALYKATGTSWSSVVVQVFPGDLLQSVALHAVPLHNEDIRKGEPSMAHDARIDAIARSLAAVRLPFVVDVRDTVALAFVDGVSACENYFMEAVYRSGKFPCAFIGGSAGGKLDFKNTYIFDGRKVIENHALIIFMKLAPGRGYSLFKSQNFKKTGQSFVVMGADPDRRTASGVLDSKANEIRPFATVLAEALKTTPANVMRSVLTPRPLPANSDGRSCPFIPCAARFRVTGCSSETRNWPNSPRSVIYAEMPRNTYTTSDLRLPPPTRIRVLLPQPEPSVMPIPKSAPPTTNESHVKFGPV